MVYTLLHHAYLNLLRHLLTELDILYISLVGMIIQAVLLQISIHTLQKGNVTWAAASTGAHKETWALAELIMTMIKGH